MRLGGRMVVRDVSFSLSKPGWFGVLGANGSGKTTLLRALVGRLDLAGGLVLIDGEDMTAKPGRRAWSISDAAPLETLPQLLTTAELTELVARSRGADPARRGALHDVLDIGRIRDVPIAAMSSGMRQRVALHLAFVGEPEILVLDEPFNWLDPVAAYDVKAALSTFATTGLLITALHDVATFATRCTAGLMLRDGQVASRFEVADLAQAQADLLAFEADIYRSLKQASQ